MRVNMAHMIEFTDKGNVNGVDYNIGDVLKVGASIYGDLNTQGIVKDYVKPKPKTKKKSEKES